MRTTTCRTAGNDAQQDHLDVIRLDQDVLKFGGGPEEVEIILNSRFTTDIISSDHAEIRKKRAADGALFFYLVDKSLNGTYINGLRAVKGPVLIQPGDTIKFGHVHGAAIAPGQHAPQGQAEFTFVLKKNGARASTLLARVHPSNRYATSVRFAQRHASVYNALFFPTD